MDKKNVILGAIYGYKWKDIKPFVETAQLHCSNTDIVLLYSGISSVDVEEIESYGVIMKKMAYRNTGVQNSWMRFWSFLKYLNFLPFKLGKVLQNYLLPFAWSRYFGYYDFLKQYGTQYQYTFITDVRDVIFQDNPFSKEHASGLNIYLEDGNRLISECDMNKEWITHILPKKISSDIINQPVSCCGTVLGHTDSIISYLKQYIIYSLKVEKLIHGGDTAIHDWIVYKTPQLAKHICNNGEGAVATLNSTKLSDVIINNELIVVNKNGSIIPIVHQYDRINRLEIKYLNK